MSRQSSEERLLKEKLRLLEKRVALEKGLPHLYGFPWYKWARQIFESTNKEIFLTSANQIGKSTTAIRKNIHWATEKELWKKLWPDLFEDQIPNLFWYFYPTFPTATTEFEKKWIPLFLPRNNYVRDPVYGWDDDYDKGEIRAIHFKSGVSIQFKTYEMKLKNIQSASVYMVTADEEMPVHYLPEIKSRLNSTGGYFLNCFTATIGQLYWAQTMEPTSKLDEKHPNALKIQISLYDSQYYEDGSPSPWTAEKIAAARANCPTEAEVQRRIYGKFVKAHGLMYESFSAEHNMSDAHPLPASWFIYAAVDPGSGGQSGHPAAILFLAVSPDYKQGRVFRGWRGDGISTAAPDILQKYQELKKGLIITQQIYDWAAKDFFTVASRIGEGFAPADKKRETGVGLVNSLFKNRMLKIQRGDPELEKLVQELSTLAVDRDKRSCADDLVDCLRYCAAAIPWDFSDIHGTIDIGDDLAKERAPKKELTETERRREWFEGKGLDEQTEVDAEFAFWNENLES